MLYSLLILFFLLLSIAAIFWLIGCTLSRRAREDRHRLAARLFYIVVLATPLLGYCLHLIVWWPPDWAERKTQRKLLLERVQVAGGWDAVRESCILLAKQYEESGFHWVRRGGNTNELPETLRLLEPRRIMCYPTKFPRKTVGDPIVSVVQIRLFGSPSSGGNASPYLGLEVLCDTNATNYKPKPAGGAPGNRHTTYRKVADDIYEIY